VVFDASLAPLLNPDATTKVVRLRSVLRIGNTRAHGIPKRTNEHTLTRN